MARKKTGLSNTLFSGIDPYGSADAEGGRDSGLLPLEAIRPDPDQPRRLLPAELATAVARGRLSPRQALESWLADPEQAEGHRAQSLRRLADSIARHGLINPISVRRLRSDEVAPPWVDYFVVTGERRYWAHVLLWLEGRSITAGENLASPKRIRATLAADGITVRAHQLIENILREDINAVEKARGLWALRFELSGFTPGEVNYSSPESEVNYSSLAAGRDLVPWKQVSEEVGISKRYRIYLTSVLDLAPEAQDLVAEHGLAEITIRPIVQKLRDEPALQVAALHQLVAWQKENEVEGEGRRAITRAVQELVEELLTEKERAAGPTTAVQQAAESVDQEARTKQFRRRLRSTLRFLHRLPPGEGTLLARDLALDRRYAETVDELRELRRELDRLLQHVGEYQEQG